MKSGCGGSSGFCHRTGRNSVGATPGPYQLLPQGRDRLLLVPLRRHRADLQLLQPAALAIGGGIKAQVPP